MSNFVRSYSRPSMYTVYVRLKRIKLVDEPHLARVCVDRFFENRRRVTAVRTLEVRPFDDGDGSRGRTLGRRIGGVDGFDPVGSEAGSKSFLRLAARTP